MILRKIHNATLLAEPSLLDASQFSYITSSCIITVTAHDRVLLLRSGYACEVPGRSSSRRFSAASATTSTKRPYEVHLPGSYGSGTGTKADAFASRPPLDDGEVNP